MLKAASRLGLVMMVGVGSSALAAPDDAPAAEAAKADTSASKSAFRGSTVTYRNSVSALTFDESAELTYNPTWVMSLGLLPRYWFNDTINVNASLDIAREITEADDTTFDGEFQVGNLAVGVSASKWATIPEAEITLSSGLSLVLPTSKWAQYQTLMFGLGASTTFARSFDVLSGLSISYGIGLSKSFHDKTTAERETPLVAGCFQSPGGCESFLNSGVRNASWRVTNRFNVGLGFTDWLSMDISFGIYTSFLYPSVDDARVNTTPQEPTSTRHTLMYDIGATVTPLDAFSVRVGASTINPQQKPDSSDYAPFFNRYTALYVDLSLDIAALVAN